MNSLLNEVRHDALKKARGIQFGEQLFALVEYMDTLNWIARREGLLSLEEEMMKIPQGMKMHKEIQWISNFITNGADPENIIEVVTTRYWLNDFQGEDAFMYYIVIYAMLKLQSGEHGRLDWLLIEFLPLETREAFYAYQKNVNEPLVAEQKATMRKNLFEDAPVVDPMCDEGVELSGKLRAADYKKMKLVLSKSDNKVLLTAMRGLPTRVRLSILILLSEKLIEMFAEDWLFLEHVTEDEVKQAFIKMLKVFEIIEED